MERKYEEKISKRRKGGDRRNDLWGKESERQENKAGHTAISRS